MFRTENLSDKAIQTALDEYNSAIKEDVSEWTAMKLAIEMALEVEKKRFPKKTEEAATEDLGWILILVAVVSLAIGMIARFFS